MSRRRKIRILLAAVLALVVGITLYFQYQSHQERFQLKTSFEEKDTIAVLKHLTASGKYASDMRKAGYIVPSDGAIRLDGGIDSIGIKGDIDFKMLNLGRDEVSVLFETRVNEEKINAYYILDHQLTLKRSYYSYIRNQNKESATISQAEEERLLKIVRKELKAFLDKMYQTFYG